jgi:hypothetical protein
LAGFVYSVDRNAALAAQTFFQFLAEDLLQDSPEVEGKQETLSLSYR